MPRKRFALGLMLAVSAALFFQLFHPAAPAKASPDLDAIIAQVEAYVPEVMTQSQVPGLAVALVADGQVIYQEAFGTRSQGGNDPVTVDTIFQIGSCSKAFTAATVASLADDGYLDWSDLATDHLPDFAMYDSRVTQRFSVDDLMAQHSGLTAYSGDYQSYLGFSREHIVDSLRYFQPISQFDTEYAYQNGFFMAASELVEEYRGTSWETAVSEQIFQPLGMDSTTVTQQAYYSENNRAALYAPMSDGSIARIPDDWPYSGWCYTYAPAGGINSNVVDMANWVIFNLGDGAYNGQSILSQDNLDWLHTPHTMIPEGFYTKGGWDAYCLGWFYSPDSPYPSVQHGGNTLGAHSFISLVPEAGIGAVVLTNTGLNLAAEAIAWRFEDLYLDRELREVFAGSSSHQGQGSSGYGSQTTLLADQAINPPDVVDHRNDETAQTCAGTYYNPIYGEVFVGETNGGLSLTIGPMRTEMSLLPLSEDEYRLVWPEGIYFTGSDDYGLVRFGHFGADGAENLVIDLINYDTGGSFTRMHPAGGY